MYAMRVRSSTAAWAEGSAVGFLEFAAELDDLLEAAEAD
jgi:hypothetical protein